MVTTTTERLKKYRAKMEATGFRRLSFYVSPELGKLLDDAHQVGECRGRTLERLLLGQSAKRPDYWTDDELAKRQTRMEAFRKSGKLAQPQR